MLIVVDRAIVSPAKSLIPAIRPLLSATLQDVLHIVSRVFPHAEQGLKRKTPEGSDHSLSLVTVMHSTISFNNCVLEPDRTNLFVCRLRHQD